MSKLFKNKLLTNVLRTLVSMIQKKTKGLLEFILVS